MAAGTEGAALEAWVADLLTAKRKRLSSGKDEVLSKILSFMNEHDKAAWDSLDDDVQGRLVTDEVRLPVENASDGPRAERKNVTPAKYKASWWMFPQLLLFHRGDWCGIGWHQF